MKTELLAPAGSFETVQAAFRAGADAVYLGGQQFGARAYAKNLDKEELIEAIHYAHIHGKRLYLTVNTLLKNREIKNELYGYLAPLYEAGLDAAIVQDFGVFSFLRNYFPELPIHASTQMTVTGVEGARLMKEAGAKRIVTARELSLREIKAIYDATHLEIESFVHGALCYCYSGQCLMSSMLGGRSGNRGRCAQPCRLPYQVYREGKRINDQNSSYPLSPKDMCTVELLPEIIESGVCSLKIEGRMKKPEYTAGVVSVYRKYLDQIEGGEKSYEVSREDLQMLSDLYNRDGFHQSYYKVRNGRNMMALRNEKKTVSGEEVSVVRNETLFSEIRKKYLEGKEQEKIKGILSLFSECPAILEISYGDVQVIVQGEIVQSAQNHPLAEERVRKQLLKTGETEFVFEELDIFMGDDVFVPMQQLNQLRRDALDQLEKELEKPYERKQMVQMETSGIPSEAIKSGVLPGQSKEITVSVTTREQLLVVLKQKDIAAIYADCSIFSKQEFEEEVSEMIKEAGKERKKFYLMLPHIVRKGDLLGRMEKFFSLSESGLAGYLVRNLESYGILKEMGLEDQVVLDSNVYTMNGESQSFWYSRGIKMDTIPWELNQKELLHRENEKSEMILYGYTPLMVSVQCLRKNLESCDHGKKQFILKDRFQKEFSVVCNCDFCYNTIYNTLPFSLLKDKELVNKLNVAGYRLSFTIETGKETQKICHEFIQVYKNGREPGENAMTGETTRGHFLRGVE